jgi:predicted phage terminase large subunit-like protein
MGEWVLSIEGAFIPFDKIKRYKKLNGEGPVLCFIDSADEGDDHTAGLFCRLVNGKLYPFDAVFNQVDLNINEDVFKARFDDHKADRVYVETNSFGKYFLRNLREASPNIYFHGLLAKANKLGRILAQSGWILQNMVWPEHPNDELDKFIRQMCSVTHETKKEDDAADCTAGLAFMTRRDFHL